MRDTIPMLVGAAPFGIIFGALVMTLPNHALGPWLGQWMSLAVFAGSSQFIAVGLVASHAALPVIWFTTLIVNGRHLLYAASLSPRLAHLPLRWRALLGMLLVDETFAVAIDYERRAPGSPVAHWHFLGSGIAMYLNWQAFTLIGLWFGAAFPGLQSLGLDFAMVATFIAIVMPQARVARFALAAIVAGGLAYAWRHLPYQLGLLAAVLAGVAVGTIVTLWQQRRTAS
ncbi:AzlC family ABC transporter permease [Pararobbsia silviterrae]|nr:AzlC family ABC transporter permease [Pararobbsia silviterrae]